LYAGKRWGGGFNEVLGIDGSFRRVGEGEYAVLSYQLARSYLKGSKAGYGGTVMAFYQKGAWNISASYKHIRPEFNIDQIGFEFRKGTEQGSFKVEYNSLEEWGPLKSFWVSWNVSGRGEYISPHFKLFYTGPVINLTFRNNWNISSVVYWQKRQEMEKFSDFYISLSLSSDRTKPIYFRLGGAGNTKVYNWRRKYIASFMRLWHGLSWRPVPDLTLSLDGDITVEFKPDRSLEHISWVWHPTLSWRLVRDLYLRWWNEVNTDIDLHRSNLLLSWNFLPKSWAYLALNQSMDSSGDKIELKDRIFVAKVRWLFSI